MPTGLGKLQCDIITPERPLFSGPCDRVTVPAHDGRIGVMPGHAPFLTELGVGIAEVKEFDATGKLQVQRFAVREGFMQIVDNKVTLLAVDGRTRDEAKKESGHASEAEQVTAKIRERQSEDAHEQLMHDRQWIEARRQLHDEEEF